MLPFTPSSPSLVFPRSFSFSFSFVYRFPPHCLPLHPWLSPSFPFSLRFASFCPYFAFTSSPCVAPSTPSIPAATTVHSGKQTALSSSTRRGTEEPGREHTHNKLRPFFRGRGIGISQGLFPRSLE